MTMAPQKPLETVITGYGLIEGPRVDAEDGLYFSDAYKGGVYRRAPDGEVELIVPRRRGVGGIVLHEDGGIVISGKNICHVKAGESRVVFDIEDAPGFNDLFTDAEGRVLVGTQRYDPFSEDARGVPGELYRIDAAGKGTLLYDDIALTNGIGFSPDGRRVYHSDSDRQHVIVHDLAEDGSCVNRRVFAEMPAEMPKGAPDGLCVDEAGCVWVAIFWGACVVRFTPAGEVDLRLEVPAKRVASVCLGGPDRRDLYIATGDNLEDKSLGGSVFRTRADVPGLPVPLARV